MNDDNFDGFMEEFEYACENVPFYQKHMAKAGLTPGQIEDVDDIKNIPHTEKKHYRKNFPMGVFASGYSLKDPTLTRSQSSGTTGERLITFEVGMLLLSRAMECTAVYPEVEDAFAKSPRKICRYAAPNCSDVECANPNSSAEDRMLSDGTLVLPLYHDLLTTSELLIKRALDEICHYQPDLYYVDPTHFAFLLRQAKRLNIQLPKAPVVATYTASNPLNTQQIKQYFADINDGQDDIVLSELVSSSEMGWLAMGCPHGQLHFNTDSFFVELIKDGHDVALGEVGELYISSMDNGAIPHLRYKTGDAFSYVSEQCDCGFESPVVEMEGRLSNFLVKDGKASLSPAKVSRVIGAPTWLDMYQLNQQSERQVLLQVMVNEHYQPADESAMLADLQALFGPGVNIMFDKVSYIATERSGKFQCVKTELETS